MAWDSLTNSEWLRQKSAEDREPRLRKCADEIDRLRAALSMTREGVPAEEAMRTHNCDS